MLRRTVSALMAALLVGTIAVQAAPPIRVGGSVKYRPGGTLPPFRPPAGRPPVRPPVVVRPPIRPGAGAAIRREIRHEIRREIRRERRNRAIFFGAMAVVGTVLRSLPPQHTTVVVNRQTFYFADGNYYTQSGGGFTVVRAPVGVVVSVLPSEFSMPVMVGSEEFFFAQGYFYRRAPNGYVCVAPPIGAVVSVIPESAVRRGDLLEYNGTFYREIPNGEYVDYEVVRVQ